MKTQYGNLSPHVRSVSAKAAYSKAARKKVVESRAKLDGVTAAIKHAVATGKLGSGDKLECAQRAMEARLAAAEARLEALRKSGEEEWEELKDELEDAWDDLSRSINKVVDRIKDGS
jgi:hypothetical protein